MTRHRDIPERWPDSKSSRLGRLNDWQNEKSERIPQHPSDSWASGVPNPPQSSHASRSQGPSLKTANLDTRNLATPTVTSTPPQQPNRELKRLFNPSSWQFWGAIVLLASSGLGIVAAGLLLKLPAVPNCPKIFWPTASASLRLYCGQLAASKQTSEDLLEALDLVDSLPDDHPLRPEINRHIEEWSLDILKIGEQQFQEGKLKDAVKIARKIPDGVPAYNLVDKQVERWQFIWSQAEAIYQKTEQELRQSNWNQAFREAVALTNIDNKYWATTKYEQLSDLIGIARKDSEQLDQAYKLSKSGNVEKILEAIKQAEQIKPESYAYKEAQNLIAESGNKLVELAKNRIEKFDGTGVLEIANKLPTNLKLAAVQADLLEIGRALSRAESGTSWDIEAALASLERLEPNRPLYKEGQQLISRWQREVEDVAKLERARTFADSGLTSDLRMAVTEARQIPQGNPRYQEARQEIQRWSKQAETIEDRPYLERATQLASFGGVASLQEAVDEASRIPPGRALSQEAQQKINDWERSIQELEDQPYLDRAVQLASAGNAEALRAAIQEANNITQGRVLYQESQENIRRWRSSMERQQDQPYLDQARTLANRGDLSGAIAAAKKIQSGRALYSEAQQNVRNWETEIAGQQRLQVAYRTANPGTPEALRDAIVAARQVPTSATARSEVPTLVNRWGYQILAMAQERSSFDVAGAIAIAKMIPSGTAPYEEAQGQIRSWQALLQPTPLILGPSSKKPIP
ncbi:hypothetical protein [Lyngbya aestuarii]|uniref:hypothetical protein n=1 Tax=Lyngbya aestuarii TaxID=118322 RepID=UPI00403DB7FD